MVTTDDAEKRLEEAKRSDKRTAYQVAANLYMQENTVTWSRFNIMLAANAIIVAATGAAASGSNQLLLLALALPIIGLFLSLIWWNMMTRGFDYHDIWRNATYALERQLCASEDVRTLHYAEEFKWTDKTDVPFDKPNTALVKPKRKVSPPRSFFGYFKLIGTLFKGMQHEEVRQVTPDEARTGGQMQDGATLIAASGIPARDYARLVILAFFCIYVVAIVQVAASIILAVAYPVPR